MIPGFKPVDARRFWREIWPKISKKCEAVESNLPAVKAGAPVPLLVQWGYRSPDGDHIILAISQSFPDGPDHHWVAPHLIRKR